jgi:hypothetical protein
VSPGFVIEARIDALPDQLRIAFMLRGEADLSDQETSAALGIHEATVRSQYFRARSLLREAVARDFDRAVDSTFSLDGERCAWPPTEGVWLLRRQRRPATACPPGCYRNWPYWLVTFLTV